MGASLSGGYNSSKTSQQETDTSKSTGSQMNEYTGDQTGIQGNLAAFFRQLFPALESGTMDPSTRAMTTATAGDINRSYDDAGRSLQKGLSQRGFGRGGVSQKASLKTELARRGSLAANESAGAATALQSRNQGLLAALNYAMTGVGSKTATDATETMVGSGKSSGWGVGAQANFGKMPPAPPARP